MASDWAIQKLGQAGVTLIDCDHRTPPAAETGFPYVAIPQMKEGRIDLSGVRRISREHFIAWTKKAKPQEHDVVLSRRCNPGVTAHVPAGLEMALGQNLVLLRADGSKIHPPFLRWLASGQEWWDQVGKFINVGAVFESLRCRDIPGFELTLPPFSQQERIAHILNTLDAKIELNRRMNATLEAMARAIYQSWFVDFDPVYRKTAGETLRSEDSLFPESFEDSAMGEVPAGWDVIPLYDTATYRNGAAFKATDFCENGDGLPVVKIAELKSGLSEQTKWSNKQLGSDQMIDTGDLLYSWSGSPDTSLDAFLWTNGPGLVNQHIFKVITSSDAEKRFVYYLLKHLRPILVETARDKQTTGLGHVTVADMKRLQVCRPPKDVLAAFDRVIAPIFDKAFANTVESQTLATLRDTLLPKLLSGELNAHELQSLKEEALA
jgi:type I restriction enzyme, S subunit